MNSPLEEVEQKALVKYLDTLGLPYTAIPNSTYTTSIRQKMKNKAMGVRAGFPDMIVLIPNKCFIAIELKKVKPKGRVSPEQEQWIKNLNTIQNVGAFVCYGADEAIKIIQKYA